MTTLDEEAWARLPVLARLIDRAAGDRLVELGFERSAYVMGISFGAQEIVIANGRRGLGRATALVFSVKVRDGQRIHATEVYADAEDDEIVEAAVRLLDRVVLGA